MMVLHRMRTIAEAVSEIFELDAGSAITAHCIRNLCNNGIVKCFYTGKKILVDMESLYDLINGEKTVNNPTQNNEM